MPEIPRNKEDGPEEAPDNREVKMVKIICAYCGKIIGTQESRTGGDSHGMCPDCFKREMEKLDRQESGLDGGDDQIS